MEIADSDILIVELVNKDDEFVFRREDEEAPQSPTEQMASLNLQRQNTEDF